MPPRSATEAALTALAQALGAHAPEAFLVLLVMTLLAVGMLAWSARRMSRGRRLREAHPLARLVLGLVAGFALIVGAAAVFAALAEEIGVGESLARLDQVFSDAVRAGTSAATVRAFGTVTHLGDPLTLFVLGVLTVLALLARGERLLAIAYATALGGNAVLNVALKHVFERVRPLHDNGLPLVDGFSFPSGHSSGSLVGYGMLAYVLMRTLPPGWHLPAVLLSTAAALSVGASRVFLQAHFATDVLAGFASGTAWLTTCIVSAELVRRRQQR